MEDLRQQALKFAPQLKKIKVFLTDCDGVLTNGHLYWSGEEVGFNRHFHSYDGYGFKLLKMLGIKVGVVSGGESSGLKMRLNELGIVDYQFLGKTDKRQAFKAILNEGYQADEILYIGDELFDIPLLLKSGFSACPRDAIIEVRECVDYITLKKAGDGCVREVVDLLRYGQDKKISIADFDNDKNLMF